MITITKEQAIEYQKENTQFWYYQLDFSIKTYRCAKIIKPVKVTIQYEDNNSAIKLVDSKGSIIIKYYFCGYNEKSIYYLFSTREDCIEDYNKVIYNMKDRLQSYYEEKLKYLDSKLIKL